MNPLVSKIALLCYVAAVAFFGIAANTIAGVVFPRASASRPAELLKDIRPNATPAAAPAKIEDYVAVKPDRFMSPPAPPPVQPVPEQPPAEQPPAPTGMSAVYVLKGTMFHSNPALSRAFIEIPGVEEERAYKIGDTVHGATIRAIHERTVEIVRYEQAYTLAVRFDDLEGGAQPAGTPTPEAQAKSENREERQNRRAEETQARQGDAQARADSWESLPQRLRERLESLDPQERERFMRMSPAERAEFYRTRVRQARDQERNGQRK